MKKIIKLYAFLFVAGVILLSAHFSLAQYTGCSIYGCYNYNNYNYGDCTYHAYKLCVGNSIYWFDSCQNQQDFIQSCYGTNMICQYGQCVYQLPAPPPYVPPVNPYVVQAKIACSAGNLYWYDSLGASTGLYKSCADANSCTFDSCLSEKCSNTIKCDGSTCAINSADYNTYCATNNNNQQTNDLSVLFFAKSDATSEQWQKTINIGANGQTYFMIVAANNSSSTINNVNILANIPTQITSLGNLKVDGTALAGDITLGVNIGSLAPQTSKTITFEGKTQSILSQFSGQATATANVSGVLQSDSVSLNFSPNQAAVASVSSAVSPSGFGEFLKRWYLWILIGLVFIFLFVVVFRRLSNNS